MLRVCLYLLFFIPWTLFFALVAMLSTLIDRSGRTYHGFALLWSKGCLLASGARVIVEGAELVPHDRPFIFMGNHQSYFDVPALFQAAPVRFNWLAKEELFRIPLFGASMRLAGYIPIDRGDGRDALKSLNKAAKLIQEGTSVAIFPEGTCSRNGDLLPFKRGGFILAAKAGVPIVPFSISGSLKIHQPGNFSSISSGVIQIKFSPRIESDKQGAGQQPFLMEQVRVAIASGMES